MRTDPTDTPAGCEYATVYIAFELSKAKWQLGIMMPGTEKMSRYRIDGGDLAALSDLLVKARSKAEQTGKPVRILSCYEARVSTVIGCTAGWPTTRSSITRSMRQASR